MNTAMKQTWFCTLLFLKADFGFHSVAQVWEFKHITFYYVRAVN